ncbi:gp53-like domain-containing protein [Sulfuriflexus mobilis]|uniref:gp53-like domain-containing protein n=1 Tax=Sulfuriflexus mobilis TaxID=1811807 RepID=UPI000F825A22|nr:hypothetical protein [Sulfuriflexus mobilis]
MDYPSDPNVGLVGGKFTDGNELGGVPASLDTAGHMNGITDEILNVIVSAGLTPDEAVLTQLDTAIATLIAGATPDASETAKGIIELAINAEAAAGTDALRALTPAALASLFGVSSPAENGYARIPIKIGTAIDEIIVQWGRATSNASGLAAVTYPIAFTAAVYVGLGTVFANVLDNNLVTVGNLSTTGMSLFASDGSGVALNATVVHWIAIGK